MSLHTTDPHEPSAHDRTPRSSRADADAPALPEPQLIGRIAVSVFEVLAGVRTVAQLGRVITREVADELCRLRALRAEMRRTGSRVKRVVPTVQGIHMSSPRSGRVEAAVVINTTANAKAVALCADFLRGRWQVTHVTVL